MAWTGTLLISMAIGSAEAQPTTRVSTALDGSQVSGGDSGSSDVSADGRYVVFASTANNLVPGDTNGAVDVFLKDRQTGAITRVSTPVGGGAGGGDHPRISADGRFVAFVSAQSLVAADVNTCTYNSPTGEVTGPCPDVYVYDRQSGALELASVSTTGTQSNGSSWYTPDISADGRYVLLTSAGTTLITGDTNDKVDVFVRDRLTQNTTRVSVATGGGQSTGASYGAGMSEDGEVIAFTSDGGASVDATADPLVCTPSATMPACTRAYIHLRSSGTTTRVNGPLQNFTIAGGQTLSIAIGASLLSGNGRYLALTSRIDSGGISAMNENLLVFDRTTNLSTDYGTVSFPAHQQPFGGAAFSGNGRFFARCVASGLYVRDLQTTLEEHLPNPLTGTPDEAHDCTSPALTDDGLTVVFASKDTDLVTGDTNAVGDVFAFNRDADGDGMPAGWETLFGLDPNAPSAGLDPDDDGQSNIAEYQAGTHPTGTFKRYLAEGASNEFFRTAIYALFPGDANPDVKAAVVITLLGANGKVSSAASTLTRGNVAAWGPEVADKFLTTYNTPPAPDQSFSTVIESNQLLAVERNMSWSRTNGLDIERLGMHGEVAIAEPRTTWYLAEGATHGAFDLFYLVQNPNAVDLDVTVTYLLPAPRAPIVLTYPVTAHSRRTIWVDAEPGLDATDVSAKITAAQPIFVERSMYLSTPGQAFSGGHAGAGIPELQTEWFVAESATGGFFDSYVLIGNPGDTDAALTVTYLLQDGTTFDKTYTAQKNSRLTIALDTDDPRLAATSLSAVVRSTNGVPIVVERATWWPDGGWYEGHLTSAATGTATKWALPSVSVSYQTGISTYLLIANPGSTDATVTMKLTGADNYYTVNCNTTIPVRAHSRVTADIADVCHITTTKSGVSMHGTLESDGPGLVIERSTYADSLTRFWAAGESLAVTKLP